MWFLVVCMVNSGCLGEIISYEKRAECIYAGQAIESANSRYSAVCVPSWTGAK